MRYKKERILIYSGWIIQIIAVFISFLLNEDVGLYVFIVGVIIAWYYMGKKERQSSKKYKLNQWSIRLDTLDFYIDNIKQEGSFEITIETKHDPKTYERSTKIELNTKTNK